MSARATTCWPSTAMSLTARTTRTACCTGLTGPVDLTVNDEPILDGARKVTYVRSPVKPRCATWPGCDGNRRKVAEATDGRVGYMHLPDMGADGIREFIKWYYAQIRKEGLVVDVRGNGGGNVSQMVIERLRRSLLGTRFVPEHRLAGNLPRAAFYGHMVCLLDEDSASDGDIFPHMFREAGLGPLIGKRSWGGVVGITNRGTLIDGGSVFVPEFGTNESTASGSSRGTAWSPTSRSATIRRW